MEQAVSQNEPNRTCGRCEADFHCGIEAGQPSCWCFDLPHVMPMDGKEYNGCLCATCLRELVNQRQKLLNED